MANIITITLLLFRLNAGACTGCDRQNSAPANTNNDLDWIERNKIASAVQEVPFVLEESEHTFPEPVNYTDCDYSAKTPNGDISAGDVPGFLRTAMDVRLSRSSSHCLGVKVEGGRRETHRKTASLDESSKNLNGNGGLGIDEDEKVLVKKEKKGFKRIFKKVF